MKREFEMSEADLKRLLDACRPVPYMVVGGWEPRSPQENANAAWADLGRKMGFVSETVEPIPGKGSRFFRAEPAPPAPPAAPAVEVKKEEPR